MARRTLLFDLDGTLWDSRPWYAGVLARLSGEPAARLERSLSSGTSIVKLASRCGVSTARLAREAKASAASLSFYEGGPQVLDRLRERDTPMGVVTNLPGWLVRPVLEATDIEGCFDAVVTPRRGVPAKPKPHGIRNALRAMGREPDPHTWLVGDDVVDAEAAKAARVRFAWASWGYGTDVPPDTGTVLGGLGEVLEL